MRLIPTLFLFCALPVLAVAQTRAPLMAVDDGSVVTRHVVKESPPGAQPDAALQAIANDEAPKAPEAPAAPAAPVAATPETPASPPAPVSKLWPKDTAAIFITSCSKLRSESIAPCKCIINRLMNEMMHDEFLHLSEGGYIAGDPRYLTIREQCSNAVKIQQ